MDIRIFGLGNVLMGDDGFGPYVIEALDAVYDFPPDVSLVDLGTPGLDLAPYLIGADAIIVVDTVLSDGAPGSLRRYERDALLAHVPEHRLGPHEPGFMQMLLTLEFAGIGPRDVVLIGVIPKTSEPAARLSPPVQKAVPGALQAVRAELERLGMNPTMRRTPSALAPWWERAARV
jgi:hydrogenase maturation protease